MTNFSPALLMVLRESKYLDRSDGLRGTRDSLERHPARDQFHHYVQELETMLCRYMKLLKKQLETMKSVLGA